MINLSPTVFARGEVSFEDTLVAADVVASSYSYSSVEATVLGATGRDLRPSQRPIGLHILPGEVRRTMRLTRAGLALLPFAKQGAMPHASRPADLVVLLKRLLFQPASRAPYFRTLRRCWHPGRSSELVMDEVMALVNR